MRFLLIFLALLITCEVSAQEYKPYPRAQITQEQWQQYFSEVSTKHAASRRELSSNNLLVFEDRMTFTSYAFTQPGHPAHPAWITRQILQDKVGVSVNQIGYFAGKEEPFAKLFSSFKELQGQMREDFKQRFGDDKK